jgi:hypothetical protein
MSDDGSRIGFSRLLINLDNLAAPELQNTEPFVMRADGSGLQQLFDASSPQENCSPTTLDQQGGRVAFICTDGSSQQSHLYVTGAWGVSLQVVTPPFSSSGLTSPPSISDSGADIAFAAKANLTGQNNDGNAEIFIAAQERAGAPATLENPQAGSVHSGVGVITGWACEAAQIDIVIDDVTLMQAGYGTSREDTRSRCGDADNGFALLINWNLLGDGQHTLRALADGIEFARSTFNVATLGQEFLTGVSGECTVANFPQPGTDTRVRWEESLQNFVIVGSSSGGQGVNGDGSKTLENPRAGSVHSGVGVITGWACEAAQIDIVIDDVTLMQAGYGTSREDTRLRCGDADNGFALLINWNLLRDGQHTLRVLADGIEFARSTFNVVTLGQEFLSGVSGECTVPNFPQPGTDTRIRWEESLQNFVVVGME